MQRFWPTSQGIWPGTQGRSPWSTRAASKRRLDFKPTQRCKRSGFKMRSTVWILLFVCGLAALVLLGWRKHATILASLDVERTPVVLQHCTAQQAIAQAREFMWKRKAVKRWTACGSKPWLTLYHELAPPGPRYLFDIGCNKGYETGLFLDLMVPQAKVNPQLLYQLYLKTGPRALGLTGALCGACNNCEERADPGHLTTTTKHTSVHAYCFEPSPVNFRALKLAKNIFEDTLLHSRARLHLVHTAVSNATGSVSFPLDCGSTKCSLYENVYEDTTKSKFGRVPVTSVDAFVRQHDVPFVDVLKVDTEGNDPQVLYGAEELLRARRVGALYFEYNSMGLWRNVTLQSLVSWLGGLQYVCYFDGQPTLARLTGCWHMMYEFKDWSNVVCVHRQHFLYPALENITFLKQLQHAEQLSTQGMPTAFGNVRHRRGPRVDPMADDLRVESVH